MGKLLIFDTIVFFLFLPFYAVFYIIHGTKTDLDIFLIITCVMNILLLIYMGAKLVSFGDRSKYNHLLYKTFLPKVLVFASIFSVLPYTLISKPDLLSSLLHIYELLPLLFFLDIYWTHMRQVEQKINFYKKERNFFEELTQQLQYSLNQKNVSSEYLHQSLKMMINSISAESGALYIIDDTNQMLILQAATLDYVPPYLLPDSAALDKEAIAEYIRETPISVNETLLGEAVKSEKTILIINSYEDFRTERLPLEEPFFFQSVIITPLVINSRPLGVIVLEKNTPGSFFSETDGDSAKVFAADFSANLDTMQAISKRLRSDRQSIEDNICSTLKKISLPDSIPTRKGLDIAAKTVSAKSVFSDYYDVTEIGKNDTMFIIGEAASKGINAAVMSLITRTIIHLLSKTKRDASTILSWINRGLFGKIGKDLFYTLIYMVYHSDTNSIAFSNAAHKPLMVYRARKESFVYIKSNDLPIGISKKTTYTNESLKIYTDDIIVLYTDGIIESMDPTGKQFGLHRLENTITQHKEESAKNISEHIFNDLQTFCRDNSPKDDQTLMIIKILKG